MVISAAQPLSFTICGVEPEKGDKVFYQIRTPPLTAQQWNPDFSSHLWTHDIKSVSFYFTHLLSSRSYFHKSPVGSPAITERVKGHLLMLVTHSSVQFEALNCPCSSAQVERVRKNNIQWLKRETGS